jgi:hypothetical protein
MLGSLSEEAFILVLVSVLACESKTEHDLNILSPSQAPHSRAASHTGGLLSTFAG